MRDGRVSLDAPIKVGRTIVPAHLEAHVEDHADGTKLLEAAMRLSAAFDRFNLGTELSYRKDYAPRSAGPGPPGELKVGLLGSGRISDVRLRGSTEFDVSPAARFRQVELSAYWSASDASDWEGTLAYDGPEHRGRARLTHVLRLNSFALALTGEAATDGAVAVGFNLNFSLDPRNGFTLSRRPLAEGGLIHATVYRDLNDNGLHDPGEPFEKGALVTTGTHQVDRKTDARGSVTVGGMTAYQPVPVGIDASSLDDPMLVPKKALQVVTPRPGIPADVEIGLIGGGDIEGTLIKSGEIGFEGLDLELLDGSGTVVATARTDFDGFFLFDRVAYGDYALRISAAAAKAVGIAQDIGVRVHVTAQRSVVRLGSVHVRPSARIASAETTVAAAP